MNFVNGVISCFGDEYLQNPNNEDLARLLHAGDQRGFPGMISSIDCMHWEWKNCPSAWAGQYSGRSGKPKFILEAVASYDFWIWHAFLGTPSSLNDINVLHRSPVFDDVVTGRAPKVSYILNGRENNRSYYLTDGIFPSWSAFVKSITFPIIEKHKLFAQCQESARKDVERSFAFIRHPCLVWDKDNGQPFAFSTDMPTNRQTESHTEDDGQPFAFSTERIGNIATYMANREQLRDRGAHNALKNDLIEHIWQRFGTNN